MFGGEDLLAGVALGAVPSEHRLAVRALKKARNGLDLDIKQDGLTRERELGDRLHGRHPLVSAGEVNRPQLAVGLGPNVEDVPGRTAPGNGVDHRGSSLPGVVLERHRVLAVQAAGDNVWNNGAGKQFMGVASPVGDLVGERP